MNDDEEAEERPSPACDDSDEWSFLVLDILVQEILEDFDYAMQDKFIDMAPDKSDALKKEMNIDDDYFVAVVEDPTPERAKEIRRELHALLDS
jgi:hypothetical protein